MLQLSVFKISLCRGSYNPMHMLPHLQNIYQYVPGKIFQFNNQVETILLLCSTSRDEHKSYYHLETIKFILVLAPFYRWKNINSRMPHIPKCSWHLQLGWNQPQNQQSVNVTANECGTVLTLTLYNSLITSGTRRQRGWNPLILDIIISIKCYNAVNSAST